MFFITIVVAALFLYALGRVLFKRLGFPRDVESAGRWGLVLLIVAVLFSSCPEIGRMASTRLPAIPTIDVWSVLPPLLILGLAAIGYVSWSRGAVERERRAQYLERARGLPRRPAAPPPPPPQHQAEEEFVFGPAADHHGGADFGDEGDNNGI